MSGRERTIAVDTLGLLLAVAVTIASIDDAQAARPVMKQVTLIKKRHTRLDPPRHKQPLAERLDVLDQRPPLGVGKFAQMTSSGAMMRVEFTTMSRIGIPRNRLPILVGDSK